MLPLPIMRRVLMWTLLMGAYSGLAAWKEEGRYAQYGDVPPALEVAGSVAIGLLLAFRVNRAFDRWWEARILWGTLVNACRNLAVKVHALAGKADETTERMRRLIVSFPYALKQHLRHGVDHEQLAERAGEAIEAEHVPSAISSRIYGILEKWNQQQRIEFGKFLAIDLEARMFLDVCGGCERIRNTPIAPSYRIALKHGIAIYLVTLPWGIVNELGLWTIPAACIATYFVVGAEAIADHIEHPFVADGDGLQLEKICAGIDASVSEIFRERQV